MCSVLPWIFFYRKGKVPDVLFTTLEPPAGIPVTGILFDDEYATFYLIEITFNFNLDTLNAMKALLFMLYGLCFIEEI